MNSKISTRSFKPEDMAQLMDMLQDVSQFIPENANLDHLASDFINNNKSSYACVAVCNEKVIGFGSVFILNRIRGGCSAVIEDVVVDESFRRKGVGRLIIKMLLDFVKEQNCFKVTLVAAEHNILFYESLGFKEDNRSMKLIL